MSFIKKNLAGIIIVLAIVGIGTCNYILNTSDQSEKMNNPEAGQYYVINDFTEDTPEIILKIKEVRDNEVEFFIPRQELIFGFKSNKSEPVIRRADENGEIYDARTVVISKDELNTMIQSDNLSSAIENKPRVVWIFQ
jgi:hypothetical protein